jgi:pimeloyl-ACP methyl ester carboxylesterase
VVTNGSIYIEMAHLTDGQQFLLALPDERLQTSIDSSGASMMEALSATFSPSASVPGDELRAAWELISHNGGDLLLPRLIRYIEDRRRNQSRYTGAIESHPSPLAIIWGSEDPIAVPAMASRLESVRNDSTLVFMDGVGHYPMIETPELFTAELIEALGS